MLYSHKDSVNKYAIQRNNMLLLVCMHTIITLTKVSFDLLLMSVRRPGASLQAGRHPVWWRAKTEMQQLLKRYHSI